MSIWLTAINTLAARAVPAVLVTVAEAEGSVPRAPGAKMVITCDRQFDTIGGGHLEMRASEIAREMLSVADSPAAMRRVERFALGPSLGQCCGGVVHLAFEYLDRDAYDCYSRLYKRRHAAEDVWRVIALDLPRPPSLHDRQSVQFEFDPARSCHLFKDDTGQRWLIDPCLAHRRHLMLFGAGHVGAALVRILDGIPCTVIWIDERDDLFPSTVPANVQIEVSDAPESAVAAAPPGSSFLVMTHSHALDQRLAEAILRRADAGWFGLIGSKTKRMQFEHRLLQRGISSDRLAAMVCPIGIPGITGKEPAVIAAAVCAQLLQVWEAVTWADQ